MKIWETGLFAAALLAVPLLAWLVGRAVGRRDWRISRVLVAGCFAALLPNVARFSVLAVLDPRPFSDALQRQAGQTLDNPEVGMFFVTLGVFVTMLGWTATPVTIPRTRPAAGAETGAGKRR